MTPEEFRAAFDVSRETIERLRVYEALLRQWNPRINLVSRTTLHELWLRHFADSAQLLGLAPDNLVAWTDLGAGAGFPGMVVAAMLAEQRPEASVRLIESDARKCAFLQAAARVMEVPVQIVTARIERAPAESADVVSARALAPLGQLLAWAQPFCHDRTVLLFPKGRSFETELTAALVDWHIEARLHPSRTEPSARIVEVQSFHQRH